MLITDSWKGSDKGRDVAFTQLIRAQETLMVQCEEAVDNGKPEGRQKHKKTHGEQLPPSGPSGQEEVALVPVRFRVRKQLKFGLALCMVGGSEQMGSWQLGNALRMECINESIWRAQAFLAPGYGVDPFQYLPHAAGTLRFLKSC